MDLIVRKKLSIYARKTSQERLALSAKKFIEVAKNKFNNLYDYSLVIYKHKRRKVKIICPKHGIFEQMPQSHLKSGCLKCKKEQQVEDKLKIFLERCNKKYNNKYDYSLVKSITNKYEIEVICPKHGSFIVNPKYHLTRAECPKCLAKLKTKEYLKYAKEIHKDKYDYSLIDFDNYNPEVEIICPEHGLFRQTLYYHSLGRPCPKCSKTVSKSETEIFEFIKSNYDGEIICKNRTKIGFELDIYLPNLNLAFELNGLFWHCEVNKDKNYHLKKTKLCEKNEIHLIHIYEDDWDLKKLIVKSRILNLLGKSKRIYGRECEIKELNSKTKKEFLIKNHLQGNINSKISLGLFYKDVLVSVMTFGKLRKALGNVDKENQYELLRFCNKINFHVIGGANKLFKYFLNKFSPVSVISYADRSWTSSRKDNLYIRLGFRFINKTDVNYYYIVDGVRKHRFNFRKNILVKEGFDKEKSERQIMLNREIYRIYNSGNLKYEFQNN